MVEARKLQTRDIWAVAKIIRSCQPEVMAALTLPSGGMMPFAQVDWEALGLPLVFSLLEQADTNLRALLADLAGVDPDELDAWPVADTMSLIAQVVEGEDWPSFLAPLSTMLRIRGPVSTSSVPATAGETATLPPLRPSATTKRSRAAS